MSKVINNAINTLGADNIQLGTSCKEALTNHFSQDEMKTLSIVHDIVKWAYVYLGWEARDYQLPILRNIIHDVQAVLRLGRRLGKTEMMCVAILWYAFTQYNKRKVNNATEDKYSILIVAPYEKQIDLIFKRLKELIEASPAYQNCIAKDIKHNIRLTNGTNILGITAGSKTGSGANSTRGQAADLIIFDEVDKLLFTLNPVKRENTHCLMSQSSC